ncbi:MAG: hypothetical protein IJS14_09255 [Lentisphaeria bacterium]|nr:hypothetical protein [Lentisphaeria bacterium]
MRTFLLAAFLCCSVLSAADRITFVRPVQPGSHWKCRIRTTQSARYSFRLPGREDPVIRLHTVRADFAGHLTIRQVNAAGNPVRMDIRAERLAGTVDGKAVTGLPAGTELEAVLTGSRAEFRGATLRPEQLTLLRSLFPPASETRLADLTGAERTLPKPGQGWRPELKPYLDMLASRGVSLPASAFQSGITYFGKDPAAGAACRKFGLLIETVRLADYDCRFRLTFWLAPEGPPVLMVREAKEVVLNVLRDNQPFAAGTRVELISEDHTEQELLPAAKLPEKRSSNGWDALLR